MRSAILALLVGLLLQPPSAPPRDGPPGATEATGTGVIRGRVVRADTGMPIRHASVSVSAAGGFERGTVALTDDVGRWEVRDLPAGGYSIHVSKAGMLSEAYKGPARGQVRFVSVRDGEVVERIDVALHRASAIEGRVVDEVGEPIVAMPVSASPAVKMPDGSIHVTRGDFGQYRTDDRGLFRIYGLDRGTYLVAAGSNDFTWERTADGRGFVRTFYPGSAVESEATPIVIGRGQEVSGLTIVMRRQRIGRIFGTVLTSTGEPFRGTVGLTRLAEYMTGVSVGRGDQRFEFKGVVPGEYVLSAHHTPGHEGGKAERAFERVTVGEESQEIVITTRPDAVIEGDVVLDADRPNPPSLASLQVYATATGLGGKHLPTPPGTGGVDHGGRFKLSVPRLRVRLDLTALPTGYYLRSILHHGADVTRDGIDVGHDVVDSVRLVLTRATGEVFGAVTDAAGRVPGDYTVLVFPDDVPLTEPMMLRHGRSGSDQRGQYRVWPLRPGRYVAVAVREVEPGQWLRAELLEPLRPRGTVFELGDGERKVVNLTLVEDE